MIGEISFEKVSCPLGRGTKVSTVPGNREDAGLNLSQSPSAQQRMAAASQRRQELEMRGRGREDLPLARFLVIAGVIGD
jgi:hypothetical protein